MEQRTDRAYRLSWDFDHLEISNQENDIEIREFPGWENTSKLTKTDLYELPEPIFFEGDFEVLPYTDFPTNNVYWPVMSRRMYYTLLALGNFPHRVIPIAIMNTRMSPFESSQSLLADGQPNPEVTNFDDFVAVQLLEESDYFDFERSEYEPSPKFPQWVRSVDRYVLTEPPEGFPPLFRLAAYSVALFISADARAALREAGIRGVAYEFLDNPLQDEIDNPVQLPTYS
ncbi:MAG: hypothetical protein WCD18_06575 [Thermosynechococcaceae cyanobacterium]